MKALMTRLMRPLRLEDLCLQHDLLCGHRLRRVMEGPVANPGAKDAMSKTYVYDKGVPISRCEQQIDMMAAIFVHSNSEQHC